MFNKTPKAGRSKGSVKLTTESDVQLYFESGGKISSWMLDVHAGNIKKADFEDLQKATVSFSDEDLFILAKDKQAFKNINSYILQEHGKKMFYIDHVKKSNSLYATPEVRLKDLKLNSVYPGVMALRALLEGHKKTGWSPPRGRQFVTGFLLPIEQSADNVLILYAANEDLNLAHMQIIPNVDKWQFNIDNFARSNKMFVQGEKLPEDQIILFDALELASVFNQLAPYPIERQYFGIKESKIFGSTAALGIACAVMSGAYAAYNYNEITSAKLAIETTQNSIESAKKQLSQISSSNFNNIVRYGSIDVAGVIMRAQELGHKASTQKISATRHESTHRITILMKTQADKDLTLASIREMKPPSGCRFAGAFTNPTIQFLELKYVCKNDNTHLSSLFSEPNSIRD